MCTSVYVLFLCVLQSLALSLATCVCMCVQGGRAGGAHRGHVCSVGVPRTLKMRASWSSLFFPGNKGRAVAISAKMQPTLHISIEVE
jgi:hypothetical protein